MTKQKPKQAYNSVKTRAKYDRIFRGHVKEKKVHKIYLMLMRHYKKKYKLTDEEAHYASLQHMIIRRIINVPQPENPAK